MLSPQYRGYQIQRDWHIPSFYDIVGDSRTTLQDCENVLIQNRDAYRNHHGSNYNTEWTMAIQPIINDLRSRVQKHTSRLSIVLRPLEIKLLAEIRSEFGNNQPTHDHFGQMLPPLQLRGLLVYDIDQTLMELGQRQPIPLGIPVEIESSIRLAAEQSTPELRTPGGIPLETGTEAFFKHFDDSTKGFTPGNFLNEKTPTAKQYINLLQCIIILNHLQISEESKRADQYLLWQFFIAELDNILRSECQRFTIPSAQQLVAPDVVSLSNEFSQPVPSSQWMKEEIVNIMSPHIDTDMEEVFRVPLPCPQEWLRRELTIHRIDSTRLRLVESVISTAVPSQRLGEIVLEIDVKTVSLTPIYATPTSRPRPLEVLLHTGISRLNPTFTESKHVLRLQHLLTGYKVYDRYDQAMVKVSFVIAGQSTTVEEHGRVQLWLPQPFQPVNSLRTRASSPLASDANTLQGTQPTIRQAIQPPKTTPSPISPFGSTGRSGSIRKWIPGFGRSSGAKSLSDGSSSTSPSMSASSSYTSSPPHSPESPNSKLNIAPIMEEARFGHHGHSRENSAQINYAVPMQISRVVPVQISNPTPGPPVLFELPGDGPMVMSPYLGDGLHPVSPTTSPMAEAYRSFGLDKLSLQDRSALGLDKTTSPVAPGNLIGIQPPNGLNANTIAPIHYQVPPRKPVNNQSPMASNAAISNGPYMHHNYAQSNEIQPNYTPYDASDFPSSHIPPSHIQHHPASLYANNPPRPQNPPPAPSTIYNPTLQSKSGRPSPSVMTSMTSRSISSLAPTVSTIKTSSGASSTGGGIARLHKKPQKPMLVIFLKSKDASARLSIVAIQIDSHTSVKRDRCDCYNSHSGCRISCLEREKGQSLLAQRWDADEAGNWNLAKLSEWQRKEGENLWPGLRRVSMKFEKMEGEFCILWLLGSGC